MHGGRAPEDVVRALARELLDDAGAAVPVNVELLASFRRARVLVVDQPQAETIAWDGERWTIRIRRRDTAGRQRFSCAHAVAHTFFMEAEAAAPGHRRRPNWSAQEEQLCDLAAAEMLLPRDPFLARCPPNPTMDDVLHLASVFEASAEATALRVATLSPVPAAMVVLEEGLKPVEIRAMQRDQLTLPGMDQPAPPTPKLRVRKSWGIGLAFIPKDKSVDSSTQFGDVLTMGGVDYTGRTGLIAGTFRVSARTLPLRRDGEIVDRVVALLFDAAAERRLRRSG